MRRLVVVVGLALLGLGLLAPPAAAETLVVADRQGDGQGPGDIRAIRLSQAGDYVLLQVRTRRGIDLDTAPAWNTAESSTSLRFNLDVGGDRGVDWVLTVEPQLGGPPSVSLAGIGNSPAPRVPCLVLAQPEPTVIRVKVHQGCINLPAGVRAFARYRFDAGGNGSLDSDDRAPQVGYTPFLPIFN